MLGGQTDITEWDCEGIAVWCCTWRMLWKNAVVVMYIQNRRCFALFTEKETNCSQ
jgi:hypothetical protein